jgi:hypothetical protein
MAKPQVRGSAARGDHAAGGKNTDSAGQGVLAIKGRLLEWHAMSPGQQRSNWTGLVEWVAWLHDRYELANDSRLPDCWPQHPGLIEELWSLKCWREALYTTDAETGVTHGVDAGGLAQHARYWHTDLRTFFTQTKFYTRRCRAAHKDPEPLTAHRNQELKREWLAGDPLDGISGPARQPGPGGKNLHRMSATEMDRRIRNGAARSPGGGLSAFVTSFGDWWMFDRDSGDWLKITDPVLHARLDSGTAARPDQAQQAPEE